MHREGADLVTHHRHLYWNTREGLQGGENRGDAWPHTGREGGR